MQLIVFLAHQLGILVVSAVASIQEQICHISYDALVWNALRCAIDGSLF